MTARGAGATVGLTLIIRRHRHTRLYYRIFLWLVAFLVMMLFAATQLVFAHLDSVAVTAGHPSGMFDQLRLTSGARTLGLATHAVIWATYWQKSKKVLAAFVADAEHAGGPGELQPSWEKLSADAPRLDECGSW